MTPIELNIIRDTLAVGVSGAEGFTLGRIYNGKIYIGHTLEDEDRRLEEGGIKVKGKTAMPLGRFRLELYHSPKHGLVPLFKDVPQFSYTEIHKANKAEELLGCVAVGKVRTETGVANCAPILARIVDIMQHAEDEGRPVFCTISRQGAVEVEHVPVPASLVRGMA